MNGWGWKTINKDPARWWDRATIEWTSDANAVWKGQNCWGTRWDSQTHPEAAWGGGRLAGQRVGW